MTNGGIWCQVEKVSYCRLHSSFGPLVVLVTMIWSAVMPPCASATTFAQSTAARSAGVRAMLARSLARYDLITCTNCAAVRGLGVGSQFVGSGKPLVPVIGAAGTA